MKKFTIIFIAAGSMFATTVSSITCSGSTVTVNATAHGLSAVQGFILSGTEPQFDGTVGLNPTTNAFTFALPVWATCASFTSGYSAVVPQQQIIQLPGVPIPSAGQVNEQALFEFTTIYPNQLACNQATAPASMTVASNIGTITTGTTTAYTIGQSISLSGSATTAVNTTYMVASLVWPNKITVSTSGVSDGTYTGLTINSGTVCPQSKYANASAALNAAIVAGTTVEMYGQLTYPANTSGATIQTAFISQYQTMQAGFTGGLLAIGYCYSGGAGFVVCGGN
jgi:hypothetical protein